MLLLYFYMHIVLYKINMLFVTWWFIAYLYDKIELLLQLKNKTFHFKVRGQLLSTS